MSTSRDRKSRVVCNGVFCGVFCVALFVLGEGSMGEMSMLSLQRRKTVRPTGCGQTA